MSQFVIHKKLIIPDDERVFVIGDTHGCYDLYKKGIKDLGITDKDWVLSLGDLIDRGKQNFKLVAEFTRKPKRHAIIGNHEMLMMRGRTERDHYHCWYMNGGDATIKECDEGGIIALCEMLKDTPIILEVEHQGRTYALIHGGIPVHYPNQGTELRSEDYPTLLTKSHTDKTGRYIESLVWERNALEYGQAGDILPSIEGIDYVFHGHTYVPDLIAFGNRVYMDTGSVFNGKICFAWFNEKGEIESYKTGDYDE